MREPHVVCDKPYLQVHETLAVEANARVGKRKAVKCLSPCNKERGTRDDGGGLRIE